MPLSCATSSASAICRAIVSASRERQARASRCARDVLEPLRERLALDELEHQEADAVRLLDAVDRADVRMIQRGEHPRLALEARQPIRVARERARQDLDRDVATELRVARAVHLAHAARAEQRLAGDSRRAIGRSSAARPRSETSVRRHRERSARRGTRRGRRLAQQRFDLAPQRLVSGDRPRRETPHARRSAGRAPRDTAPRPAASVQASSSAMRARCRNSSPFRTRATCRRRFTLSKMRGETAMMTQPSVPPRNRGQPHGASWDEFRLRR